MRITSLVLLCLIACLATISCDGDKTSPTDNGKINTTKFTNLQNKDDVLYNLELAYNERNEIEYNKLLDDNFTFVFSEVDYNLGLVDFPQWDRVGEVRAHAKILDQNLTGDKCVISIDLAINYPADNWKELPANEDHPGESWYIQTVNYDLSIKTADDGEHRAIGLQAQFVIRWAETDHGAHWRIILWRDDVGSMTARFPRGPAGEGTTWGSIKAMY